MTNTETVQQALGAVRTGELDRARELVHDDFVWHIPGTSTISGDARGVEEWATKLAKLLGAGLQPQVIAMMESESHVAAVQRNTASAGSATLDVLVVNLFTMAEGKVSRLDTFFGDQTAAESFWNTALA